MNLGEFEARIASIVNDSSEGVSGAVSTAVRQTAIFIERNMDLPYMDKDEVFPLEEADFSTRTVSEMAILNAALIPPAALPQFVVGETIGVTQANGEIRKVTVTDTFTTTVGVVIFDPLLENPIPLNSLIQTYRADGDVNLSCRVKRLRSVELLNADGTWARGLRRVVDREVPPEYRWTPLAAVPDSQKGVPSFAEVLTSTPRSRIRVYPFPTVGFSARVRYVGYSDWPTEDDATHWLLEEAEDVLEAGTCVRMAPYLKDADLRLFYQDDWKQGLKALYAAAGEYALGQRGARALPYEGNIAS